MPRDSNGTYTLPNSNPVASGTLIEAEWANITLEDIAAQLNNVLTRDGLLGLTQPLRLEDGIPSLPGLCFKNAPGTGLWRDNISAGYSYNGVIQWQTTVSNMSVNVDMNVPTVYLVKPITYPNQASTKAYVDSSVSFLSTGLTQPLRLADGIPALPGLCFKDAAGTGLWRSFDAAGYSFNGSSQWQVASAGMSVFVPLNCGTVYLSSSITQPTQAATKAYVDSSLNFLSTGLTQPLRLADGTLSLPGLSFKNAAGTGLWRTSEASGFSFNGLVQWQVTSAAMGVLKPMYVGTIYLSDPIVEGSQAATKAYVDRAMAQAIAAHLNADGGSN